MLAGDNLAGSHVLVEAIHGGLLESHVPKKFADVLLTQQAVC